jgi:hypothetical protein
VVLATTRYFYSTVCTASTDKLPADPDVGDRRPQIEDLYSEQAYTNGNDARAQAEDMQAVKAKEPEKAREVRARERSKTDSHVKSRPRLVPIERAPFFA